MGLKSALITPHGLTVEYTRIRRVTLHADEGTVEVLLAYYLNEEIRKSGGTPIWHEQVSFEINKLPEDFRAEIYRQLSSSPFQSLGLAE